MVMDSIDMRPDVSFVVPTYNSERTIAACLNSLVNQIGVMVEVIVVDNQSTDLTQEIVENYPVRLLITGPERSAQRNAGLREARSDIVVFIDSDMMCDLMLASQLMELFTGSRCCGIIPEVSFGKGYLASARALDRSVHVGNELVEAARAFTRSDLIALGGFDEHLSAGEDWELDDRVREANWSRVRTEAVIWHDEGRIRLLQLFRKKRYYSRFLVAYLNDAKHRRSGLVGRYRSSAVIESLLRSFWMLPGILVIKITEWLAYRIGSVSTNCGSRQ